MTGHLHSVESMGALDGPGLRYVLFMQGCPLACGCCHNPDTRPFAGGTEVTDGELFERILRYRPYFGAHGGVTASGGEPLCQADFLTALFDRCHAAGISTCLDTSGCLSGPAVEGLLDCTDYVLLDDKYPDDTRYRANAGMGRDALLAFLALLDARRVPTVLRRVVIPGKNDAPDDGDELAALAAAHPCVREIELLPFRKLCAGKYAALGLPFPFADIEEPDPTAVRAEEARLRRVRREHISHESGK